MSLTHISRLAFGLARPDGSTVPDAAWSAYEAETLARSFPDGFTVIPARGAWRDAATGRTISENTVVVEVAHDGSDEAVCAIRTVAAVYKTIFQQDAVMVSTFPASVDFI